MERHGNSEAKYFLAVFVAVALMMGGTMILPSITGGIPLKVEAETVKSGICGENVTWNLDDEGMLVIKGNGRMEDYSGYFEEGEKAPWYTEKDSIKKVVIGDGITHIGEYAFQSCSMVIDIQISNSVEDIGKGAFYDCYRGGDTDVPTLTIPGNVKTIGADAFMYCNELKTIIMEEGVKSIEIGAFYGCSSLENITFPSTIEFIGYDTFTGSVWLKNQKETKDYVIVNNILIATPFEENIIIPDTVTSIQGYGFVRNTCVKNITIPQNVTYIGQYAFESCTGLDSIVLSENVTEIGESAFQGCSSLKEIYIPAKVECIGKQAFNQCDGVVSIQVDNKNEFFDSRNNCNAIVETSSNTLVFGCKETVIPTDVTSIADLAFFHCSTLEDIVIPDTVTNIGRYVFDGCEKVVIHCNQKSYAYQYAVENNIAVKLLDGGTSSEEDKNPADTSGNTNTQPSGDTTSPSDTPASGEDKKPADTPVASTPAAKGSVLQVTDLQCKVKVLSDDVANPTVTYLGTTTQNATTINVPDTVTVDNITYKVTEIANKAFSGNKKVKSVTVGKNVVSIGKEAFKNCTKLKSVNIKSTTLNKIGANAFSGSKCLTKITLKTTKLTKNSIGKNALKGTSSKLVIKVPKSKVKNYQKLFKNKGNKSVSVSKSS